MQVNTGKNLKLLKIFGFCTLILVSLVVAASWFNKFIQEKDTEPAGGAISAHPRAIDEDSDNPEFGAEEKIPPEPAPPGQPLQQTINEPNDTDGPLDATVSSALAEQNAYQFIDRAKEGNVEAAIEFLDQLSTCKSAQEIEAKSERMSDFLEQVAAENGLDLPASLDRTMFENKAADARASCIHFMADATGQYAEAEKALLSKLGSEAASGNAVLRFMYSLWRPDDRTSILSTENVLDYQEMARAYTELNFLSDPELALLALGISYSEGKHFTPHRLILGRAYLWAAGVCGIDMKTIDKLLARYAVFQSIKENFGQMEVVDEVDVQERALQISSEACPTSSIP